MAAYDTVIRGGTVVTASDMVRADIGIVGGRVASLGENLDKGAHEIDAGGRLVMPGGVDSHCHIEQPGSTGGTNADTFTSGSISAACGGTTTTISFSPQVRGRGVREAMDGYAALARKSVIDYCFHIIVNDPSDAVIEEELPELIAEGHRSIKVFMTYPSNRMDDAQLLKVFACAKKHEAFVCVHAENHDAIMWMTDRLLEAGLTSPRYHAWSKPPVVEREAVHRVIALAELLDLPIQVFHVTCGEAAEEIRRAQARGVKVFGETCPQYLTLTADDMDRDGFEGAKFICSPAPRTEADHEEIWRALTDGTLGIVSSDHAPYSFDDPRGKALHGANARFSEIPNGVPGLETRLPLVFSEGVAAGRIDPCEFVALTSANPARLFGLYPKKGTIAVGSDADIAIWDPEREVTIRSDELHTLTDYTPYEGMTVTGWPVMTLSRGEAIWNDGEVTAEPGRGRWLKREPYDFIRPTGRFTAPFDPIALRKLEE